MSQSWKLLHMTKGGDELDGEDLFVALHRAVDLLHGEPPGGVSAEVVVATIEDIASCVETLINATNRLRRAKGLPPLAVPE